MASFLADGFNIFIQDFAKLLPYIAFRFSWQTLQTSLQLLSFLGRALFAVVNPPKIFKLIHFLAENIKTRNTSTHWRLQTLPLNKPRDSDSIILTARHSTD